uniref:Transmembrane protein n=1 Tax=Nelumbo nucifera TaxID=4432 RepID=A0A822Y8L1_NELNU|nr:TPA_asm: hypothetical protein HUJ06_028843 [Nelumbo nucifera]
MRMTQESKESLKRRIRVIFWGSRILILLWFAFWFCLVMNVRLWVVALSFWWSWSVWSCRFSGVLRFESVFSQVISDHISPCTFFFFLLIKFQTVF